MRILHINTSQEGGAAWCARRISNALVKEGVDSRMLFAHGTSLPAGIDGAIAERDKEFWYTNPIFAKVKHLLMRMPWYMDEEKMKKIIEEKNIEHLYLHQPYSSFKKISHHCLIEWADIIHLHWVPDFVDYLTFFKDVKKPIVWTLHDKYPAMGVQHYCSEFSPVPEELKEIDTLCRKIKRKGILKTKKLYIVAISELMQQLCRESDVLEGLPCTLIHNGVDIEVFKPTDSYHHTNQEVLASLPENTIKLMFSAFGIWDKNKGLDRVIEALEKVKNATDKSISLIVVGNYSEINPKPSASFPIILTGLIREQGLLSSLYTSADFFILSSYEETFAQTPLEAMACGTPVISTPCSGASDLIRPFNGVICQGYDSETLKEGILKALSTNYDSKTIRDYIIENFEYSKIAKQYIELYNSILNK